MSSLTRPLIVIGTNRSGTSSLAGALRAMGAYWGEEKDFPTANQYNEEGYWEHNEIVELNRRFLTSLNLRYYQVGTIPDKWEELPRTDSLIAEMQALLTKHFTGKPLWGWKDPLTSILMPFHLRVLNGMGLSPHFVICVRNPLDVAASLARRDQLAEGPALGVWIRYTLSSLRDTSGQSRTVMLFSDFLKDPRKALEPTVEGHGEWKPDEAAWEAACATVRSDLVHSQRPLSDLDVLPPMFRKTFELCQEAAADPKALNAGAFDARVSDLWDELSRWMDYLSDPNPPTGSLSMFWQKGAKQMRNDTPYLPKRGWETLKLPVDADPNTWITGALYHLPCTIWIRKALWRVGDKEYPITLRPGRYGHIETEYGMPRLWVSHGPEQLAFQTPMVVGPYEFEMEVFMEMNLQITNQIFATLVQQIDAARNHAAQMEARMRRMEGSMGGFTRKNP